MTTKYYVEQARAMSYFALKSINKDQSDKFRQRRDDYMSAARRYKS